MKKTGLSSKIMKRIVAFERNNLKWWFIRFSTLIIVLIIVILISSWIIVKEIIGKQTFELLQLFQEDIAVVSDYWFDTVQTFWEESPHWAIIIGIVTFITLVILIIFLWKKLVINRRKYKLLAKKDKTEQNLIK